MPFFTSPTSFRNANYIAPYLNHLLPAVPSEMYQNAAQLPKSSSQHAFLPPHSSHPNFGHLTLLVFEAVLEVVCVSLPGYIVARQGLFNEENQKFIAHLNILLFTPCLSMFSIYETNWLPHWQQRKSSTNWAPNWQLINSPILQWYPSYLPSKSLFRIFVLSSWPKLSDFQNGLAILWLQWGYVSISSQPIPRCCQKFILYFQVFANSNSLPISLVLSLSQTIRGLHWDKIPGDNDDEVAARGILYLLIFQQLGQLLRWSWGINVLLKKEDDDDPAEEFLASKLERGKGTSFSPSMNGYQPLINESTDGIEQDNTSSSSSEPAFESGGQTPVTNKRYSSSVSSKGSSTPKLSQDRPPHGILATPANGNIMPSHQNGSIDDYVTTPPGGTFTNFPMQATDLGTRLRQSIRRRLIVVSQSISAFTSSIDQSLPPLAKRALGKIYTIIQKLASAIWLSLNPPLLAMGAALVVASIPSLQRLFFRDGTFVKNSITSAIRQSGGVAVPLILVVLGANLARSSKHDSRQNENDSKVETRLLIASLLSRMVLPTVVMAPLLAIAAKYIPVSILDDPIFVIVCFLLAGAPSALQLAQICQLNEVYMGAMTRILFHSYVIW